MIHRFKSSCCPDADGRQPQPGEQKWTLSFPLEGGGDYLEVEVGSRGRNAILAMLAQEERDDEEPAGSCRWCSSPDTFVRSDGWKECNRCRGRWWK